jgi:hypothetical protein
MPIREYTLSKVLQGLGINFEEVGLLIFLSLNFLIFVFFSSLRIYVFYLVVIIVIQLKVLDKNVHLI